MNNFNWRLTEEARRAKHISNYRVFVVLHRLDADFTVRKMSGYKVRRDVLFLLFTFE